MIALSKVNSYSGLSHDGMKHTIYDHGDDKDNGHDVVDIDNSECLGIVSISRGHFLEFDNLISRYGDWRLKHMKMVKWYYSGGRVVSRL